MIDYIEPNTKHNHEQPQAIYSYLDNILNKTFGGCSFVLAYPTNDIIASSDGYTAATCPRNILGKPFFFTNKATSSLYAFNVPGAKITSGQKVEGYNHQSFIDAINNSSTVLSTGSSGDIVTVVRYPSSYYTGSTINNYVGLLENSLQCHKLNVSGSDYYIREAWYNYISTPANRDITIPEKKYKYALAELFIENYGNVTISSSWDKYECFRVHNLNNYTQSITFEARNGGSNLDLLLNPWECRSVRLNSDGDSFNTQSMRYFFDYRYEDKRFYYYKPSYVYEDYAGVYQGIGYSTSGYTGQELNIRNAHVGNNLLNFGVAVDFIYSLRKLPYGNQSNYYAHLILDEQKIHPITNTASLWGNTGDDSTPFVDLIWSKGRIDYTITSASVLVSSSYFNYNGFNSIVNDFSSASINVIESGSTLYLSSSISKVTSSLSCVGTNIFDYGDSKVSSITLKGKESYKLNSSFFEYKSDPVNFVSGTYVSNYDRIYFTTGSKTNATSSYYIYDGDYTGYTPSTSQSVSGLFTSSLSRTYGVIGSFTHSLSNPVTVGDVRGLKYLGTYSSGSNQDDNFVSYTNKQLNLTDEGITLTFNECINTDAVRWLPKAAKPYWVESAGTYPRIYNLSSSISASKVIVPHTVKFRNNGFGYPELGSDNILFHDVGLYRYKDSTYYTNRLTSSNGSDFNTTVLQPSIDTSKTYIERIKTSQLVNPSYFDRFWRLPNNELFRLSNKQYNLVAQYVNSIVGYVPLSYKCLRFYRQINTGLDPYNIRLPDTFDYISTNLPVPVDCFFSFNSGSATDLGNYSYIFNLLNVQIRTTSSFGNNFLNNLNNYNTRYYIQPNIIGNFSNAQRVGNYILADYNANYSMSLSSSVYGDATGEYYYPYNIDTFQVVHNLKNDYTSNFLYVTIDDVKNGLNSLGFKAFSYFDLYSPLVLDRLSSSFDGLLQFSNNQSLTQTPIAATWDPVNTMPAMSVFNNVVISSSFGGYTEYADSRLVMRYCQSNESASFKRRIDNTITPSDIYNIDETKSPYGISFRMIYSGQDFYNYGLTQAFYANGTVTYASDTYYIDSSSFSYTDNVNHRIGTFKAWHNNYLLYKSGSNEKLHYKTTTTDGLRSIGVTKYYNTSSFGDKSDNTCVFLYNKGYYGKTRNYFDNTKAKYSSSFNAPAYNFNPVEVKQSSDYVYNITSSGHFVICPDTGSRYTYLYQDSDVIRLS